MRKLLFVVASLIFTSSMGVAQPNRWYFLAETPANDQKLYALGQEVVDLMIAAEQGKGASRIEAEYMDEFAHDDKRRITARFPFPDEHYVDVFATIDRSGNSYGIHLEARDKQIGRPFSVAFQPPEPMCGHIGRDAFPSLKISESSWLYDDHNPDSICEGNGAVFFTEEERIFLQ